MEEVFQSSQLKKEKKGAGQNLQNYRWLIRISATGKALEQQQNTVAL